MRAVLIGVGNRLRGDDGAGPAVAELARRTLPSGVCVVTCEEEPSRLIESWRSADVAVLVDALEPAGAPGAVWRFDATGRALPARSFRSSTHAFGVGETIELARALGTLPRRLIVYGIEGAVFDAGSAMTEEVVQALEGVARRIVDEIEEATCTSAR